MSEPGAGPFGPAVRDRRLSLRMTQEQLAERAGLSVRSVSAIERGRVRYPRPESARLIGRALELAGDELAAFEALAREEYWDDRGPVPPPAGQVAVRPAQLPPGIGELVGREAELAALDGLLEPAGGLPIAAVSGTAGVGKTALAVHWAHRARDAFPDGQLHADLRGFGPAGPPADPAVVLRAFLDALGAGPGHTPATLDEQAALYRSLLDGRRMLVLLDNARDVEQVRPLLPGSAGCLVVVTSRHRLTGLVASHGARPLVLGVLDDAAARRMLIARIGASRAAAEAPAVEEIVRRCARLPLALGVVAARAATHPTLALSALADELRGTPRGLDGIDGGDPATDVRAVFSSSYRALHGPARRLFRLLGLHPGPHLGAAAAGRLAALEPAAARSALAELLRGHLITEEPAGRFGLHDLLRAYAAELADAEEPPLRRADAVARLLRYYAAVAQAAAARVWTTGLLEAPEDDRCEPVAEAFADRAAALAWFAAERPALGGLVLLAAEAGADWPTVALAAATGRYLQLVGGWAEQQRVMLTGVEAAERLGRPPALVQCRLVLAQAQMLGGDCEGAHEQLRRALDTALGAGDTGAALTVRLAAGRVYEQEHRHHEAIAEARRALAELGDDRSELRLGPLNTIAWQYALLGAYDEAIQHSRAVVEASTGLSYVVAAALRTLGYSEHRAGRPGVGRGHLERSAATYQQLGNRYREAATLDDAAAAMLDDGDAAAAGRAWRQALHIYAEFGHPAAADIRAKLHRLGGQ
ncbi:ATP-binding protein [Dactylosporangium sp. NPDC051541]|uniref:ATP-binding protein n=1 Tax=Dactylosporangium sp. NPDC051541 TaxID=3363977 RepID=UPI0037905E16